MPYSIRTRDGIQIDNIPDDIQPDDDRLKQAVEQRRSQGGQGRMLNAMPETPQQRLARENPAEYDIESPAYKEKYGATSGMGGGSKALANLGAGFSNFGLGAAQLALPKRAERAIGITDDSIEEGRKRDDELANSMTGGRLLQLVGEAAPLMAVPGGAVARGLGALPKVGASIKAAGIGSRFMPTLLAEGATLGAASGAITPTKSDESTVGNTVMGGIGGAVIPAGLQGLKSIARPLIPWLRERGVAADLGKQIDVSPKAITDLERGINKSAKRVVDAPQSTAAITQNDDLARMELAARANADTAPAWSQLDDAANTARWEVLDKALGKQSTVDAAIEATENWVKLAKPEVMKAMKKGKLAMGVEDLAKATDSMLTTAQQKANDNATEVFAYMANKIHTSDKSANALWNIRKTLREWQQGRPPPGKEGTRGAKMDKYIQESVNAIDEVLNRASGNKWSKFLERYGEFAQKEAEQKAGQNIRNAFMGEITGEIKGAATKAGSPVITRAKLAQALETHGKNKFGETLDHPQRDVINQVMNDLRMDEILQRVKSSATGKGGSQTAPLLSLMGKAGAQVGGGKFTQLANWFGQFNRAKKQQLINQILLEPQDALALMKLAQRINRPLNKNERLLLQATRAMMSGAPAAVATLGQSAE